MIIQRLSIPTPEDAKAVSELMLQLQGALGRSPNLKDVEECALENHMLVARDYVGSAIIGMATIVLIRRLDLWKADIQDFVVHQNARRRGIGRALMLQAIDIAREAGAGRCELFTNEITNALACGLYKKLGFEKRANNARFVKVL